MDSIEIKGWKKDPTVAPLVRATFPSYNRQKVYIRASEKVTLYDLNWSGGTRSEYRAVTLDGEPLGDSAKYSAMAPWDNPAEGATLPVPQGAVMVRGGYFLGKESILTIHVNPADMPKYLSGVAQR